MGSTKRELLRINKKGLVNIYMLQYSIACSLVFFKVALVLVNIYFIYHAHKARNLCETRIYAINTTLKKKQLSINQHRIRITIQ